jgi:hypothetical protein
MKVTTTIYTTPFEHYKNLGLDPLPIPYDQKAKATSHECDQDFYTLAAGECRLYH